MKRAEFDRLDRIRQRIVRRQNDHRQVRARAPEFAQDIEPVGIRQAEIEQHEIRLHLRDLQPPLHRIGRTFHHVAVPFQNRRQSRLHDPLVVDDDDLFRLGIHGRNQTRPAGRREASIQNAALWSRS